MKHGPAAATITIEVELPAALMHLAERVAKYDKLPMQDYFEELVRRDAEAALEAGNIALLDS